MKKLIALLSIGSLILNTACGSATSKKSSPKPVVTTLTCNNNSYYDHNTKKWYVSPSDQRECTVPTNNTSGNLNCTFGQLPVRVPKAINERQTVTNNCQISGGYQYCQVDTLPLTQNYHTDNRLYTYTCVNFNDHFVRPGNGYYYYDVTGMRQYGQQQGYSYNYTLSPKQALAVLGVGIIGTILWNRYAR